MPSVGYLYDPEAHAAANAGGENYWLAYLPEIFEQLGATAHSVNCARPRDLERSLPDLRLLVAGDARSADLNKAADMIAPWVEKGGTLVAFASEGIDGLLGNAFHSVTPQISGDFEPTALLRFPPHPLTTGVTSALFPAEVIPLFGPLRKVVPENSGPLAWLLNTHERQTVFPAVTHRSVGAGHAYYLAFDLAQTMWVLHKGRPVDGDYDLDGYLRITDALVTRGLRQDVPHADLLLMLLQNLLHHAGIPLVHQLPPRQGEITDLLVFLGGDDEGLTDGSQVAASEFMKSRGLPYHINIMPDADGQFGLSRPEHDQIVANGHETSLHYNFMEGFAHPSAFTQEDVQRQWDWFCRAFGHQPVATVMHWFRWVGWSEPAQWMRAVGGRADNSRYGGSCPPLNPTNTVRFFGTAFPHYYYEDWRGENRKVDFLCEPVVAYEVGYSGDDTDFDTLRGALEAAAYYHLTMDFFYHPIHIVSRESCRRAIDELLRYVDERGWRAAFLGCDALWEWWDARSRSSVNLLSATPSQARLAAACKYAEGMVVKIPIRGAVSAITVGGVHAVWAIQEHCGLSYALVVCPPGEHEITVAFG